MTFIWWHVDETYIRVSGKWPYLWRIVDQDGCFVDFRLTARRDAKAAKATIQGNEAFSTNKRDDIHLLLFNVVAEVRLLNEAFNIAA